MKTSAKGMKIGTVPRENVSGPYSALTINEPGMQGHDLAGDETLLFVGQVIPSPCFRVFHQKSGKDLGVFPAPARGHFVPFKFKLRKYETFGDGGTRGTVYMMDGLYPKIAGLHDTLIVEYGYEYTLAAGLKTWIIKEHAIPSNTVPLNEVLAGALPNGAMYITGLDFIDDQTAVLADCFAGVIWIFDMKTDALTLAFTGPDMGCLPWPKEQTVTLPDGTIKEGFTGWTHKNRKELVQYTYAVPDFPGVPKIMYGLHGMTLYEHGTTKKAVFVSPALPGIYAIDLEELLRTDIPYNQKKFEAVVPPIKGVSSWVAEVQADAYNPGSPWVYFQRAMSRANEISDEGYEQWIEKYYPVYRVNMETKETQFVADDWKLYDFCTNINVLPGKPGYIRLTSTPVMQERIPHASGLIDDANDFSKLPDDYVFPVVEVKS
jgi:hypothetical protein